MTFNETTGTWLVLGRSLVMEHRAAVTTFMRETV